MDREMAVACTICGSRVRIAAGGYPFIQSQLLLHLDRCADGCAPPATLAAMTEAALVEIGAPEAILFQPFACAG